MPTIYFGSDHGGFLMKKEIIERLNIEDFNFEIKDLGCYSVESCDYPEFAFRVGRNVREDEGSFGVLLCGTGIGMTIAANKIKGIRCALCNNYTSVNMARKHNNANIIALGSRNTSADMIIPLISAFINTEFDGGKHKKRVNMVDSIGDL
jgi:RpiB/LacA/LacB family sugar-phosphate isomerase